MRVAIIGGGVAGCAAALAAAGKGAEVTVLARAPGATALYAGGMEICGELDELPVREPFHPFVRLGLDPAALTAALDRACTGLIAGLARGGLTVTGDWRVQGAYLDVHGRPRPAQLVPASVVGGELGSLRGRRLAVIGFEGIGEYDAATTARTIGETLDADVLPVVVDAELGRAASLTDLFERPAPRPDVAADLLLYPPGIRELPDNGVELLATTPSPHGLRLQRALDAMLADHAVEVRRQAVGAPEVDGRRVLSAGGVEADRFVLATGRYLGGGLVKEGRAREPLFDLGIYYAGRPVDGDHAERLRHLEYLSPDPAFRTGLLTDAGLRPLGWDGEPAYENLLAAGSILGGYDYGREFGFGVPTLTGWLAGEWAAT
jgi:glycerol-3-phosphate dehydrogenase subunit B